MDSFNAMDLRLDNGKPGGLLIEASAGTGKTYTITNLCLRLLLGRDLPQGRPLAISEILILTFTIAATEELKHRIVKRISEARQAFRTGQGDDFLMSLIRSSADESRDLKLLSAALQLIDEASIFTIHGFCNRVLAEQAFESGALFNQSLNAERDQLLKTAAEDYFRTRVLPLPAGIRQLAISLWPNPASLARRLTPYLFRGPLKFYPSETEFDGTRLVDTATRAREGWCSHDLETLLGQADLNKGRKPYTHLSQMTQFCREGPLEVDSELWQIYSADTLASALRKGGQLPAHPVLDLIDQVAKEIPAASTHLWHQAIHGVGQRMQDDKQTFNKMTLDDLLTSLAQAVLRPGSTLPAMMAARWPVAMIDEYQDTDVVQNSIFSSIYQQQVNSQLLMIGDPKQAIYQFRGADIYTYINARRRASSRHHLAVNWRSSPALIEATNHLFNKPNIFGDDGDIPFVPVEPAPPHKTMQMTVNDRPCTPYQIFVADTEGRQGTVAELTEQVMNYAAEETVALINGGSYARLDGKPVDAGQIAFLVRRRSDALAAQRALSARGIQSVYLTLESVFLQDTAADLKLVLQAMLEPTNDHAIRAALATRLFQSTAADIDRLNHDIQMQQQVHAEFRDYHQLWLDKDIAPTLNALIDRRGLARKWLQLPDGERQLTNLRHLIEILQQRSSQVPGMYQLIKWFNQEQKEAETVSNEERQLRLESDENLVKIVTMHAAKGLEYDIVMIPMPVFGKMPGSKSDPILFHEQIDGEYVTAVELGTDPEHRALGEQEQQEEDMRLLYVAVTRARYRCYLGLPRTKNLPGSAIATLLGIDTVAKDASLPELLSGVLPNYFEICKADETPTTRYAPGTNVLQLQPPPRRPGIDDSWRIHSYTGVAARLIDDHGALPVTGYIDDDQDDARTVAAQSLDRHNFPRGARIGVALHSLMEDVNFQADRRAGESRALCTRTLRRLGLSLDWLPVLENWVEDILGASLGDFSLNQIPAADRLDEMEFHFPLRSSTGLVDFLRAQGFLQGDTHPAIALAGQMTGLVDLLFRREGRYYLADYKSNHLGSSMAAYGQGHLEAVMQVHQYHLQYLIYCVAVHRMLAFKLPDYHYDTHFGGVYYLFLRGMNRRDTSGIYFTRPTFEVIAQLDELLGGTGD